MGSARLSVCTCCRRYVRGPIVGRSVWQVLPELLLFRCSIRLPDWVGGRVGGLW